MEKDQTPRLYLWYRGFLDAHFWLPIFFLYFNERVGVAEVLLLESVYYFSVVILEIPSGYFSDRFGRRKTLLIASACLTASFTTFYLAQGIELLIAGQVLLAFGLAFNSGTDTSLHYDSLAEQGMESEYSSRESIVARNSLVIGAISAIIGGVTASFHLQWAYALSALAMAGAFLFAFQMREPRNQKEQAPPFLHQIRECISYLSLKPIAWIFSFVLLMVVLNHIPYMFYQPYLKELLGLQEGFFQAPLAAGLIAGFSALLAAYPAARSVAISRVLGTHNLLIIACLIQVIIIGGMAGILHYTVAGLILLRVIPRSLTAAPINAYLVPRIASYQRATFLSIQSLCGRVAFAFYLIAMSYLTSDAGSGAYAAIQIPLTVGTLIAFCGLIVLWFTRPILQDLD